MPVFPCKHPTCSAYVDRRGRYCPAHQEQGREARRERDQVQASMYRRDPDIVRFYHSTAWHRARRTKLAHDPICERCREVFAAHVHHRIPLERCTERQRTDQANLESMCAACHGRHEMETRTRDRLIDTTSRRHDDTGAG